MRNVPNPKSIQEAVFLAVCNSEAGAGIEQPWESQYAARQFNKKGQLVESGFVELTACEFIVPFTAVWTFGKPQPQKNGRKPSRSAGKRKTA